MTTLDCRRTSRLSVAVIARDEEPYIQATIDSVRAIADEIVVLDTGSRDATVQTARRAGARVLESSWTDDFAAARNRLMGEASGDWLLWLNADERLAPDTESQLREFLNEEAAANKVYCLMVSAPASAADCSDEQQAQPRLLPRIDGLRYAGRIRESLRASMDQLSLVGDMAPGRICRSGRVHDRLWKAERARQALRLVEREAKEMGCRLPRLLLAEGEAYNRLGDPARARRAYEEAVAASPPQSVEMLEAYYGLLGSLGGDDRLRSEQLSRGLQALEVFPLDAQLLCAMGNYVYAAGRVDLAERSFTTAVKHGVVNLETWHLVELAEVAAASLSLTLQLQGRLDDARRVLTEALAQRPKSARLAQHWNDLVKRLQTDRPCASACIGISAAAENGAWRFDNVETVAAPHMSLKPCWLSTLDQPAAV